VDASLRVSHLLHHQRPRDETDSYAVTGRNRQPAGLDKKQDDVVFVVGRELRTGRRKSRPGPARRGRRETAVGAGEGKTGQHWGRAVEPQWVVQLRLPGRHKISPPRQRPSQAGVRSQRCQKLLQMPRKRPALLGSDAASCLSLPLVALPPPCACGSPLQWAPSRPATRRLFGVLSLCPRTSTRLQQKRRGEIIVVAAP